MTCLGRNAAERSYASPKVRDGDRECQAVSAQEQPRGATPHLRSGAAAKRSNPKSKEQRLHRHRRAEKSYSTFKVRRYPSFKVTSNGCTLLEQP